MVCLWNSNKPLNPSGPHCFFIDHILKNMPRKKCRKNVFLSLPMKTENSRHFVNIIFVKKMKKKVLHKNQNSYSYI